MAGSGDCSLSVPRAQEFGDVSCREQISWGVISSGLLFIRKAILEGAAGGSMGNGLDVFPITGKK